MRVYTSYFGRHQRIVTSKMVPVSIARSSPKFFHGEELKDLAPSYEALRKKDNREFYEAYSYELNRLDPKEIARKIKAISERHEGRDVVLCCYEKVSDYCHRHIAADWLEKSFKNLEIKEFFAGDFTPEIRKKQREYYS